MRLRVEGAALGGVPVFFGVEPDLPVAVAAPPAAATPRDSLSYLLLSVSLTLAFSSWRSGWPAETSWRGRADRQGAFRLAAVVARPLRSLTWMISGSHSPEVGEVSRASSDTWRGRCFAAALVWVPYIALEPLLRRRSPASLVSWTRLLAGRARDPLVGRDLLLGALMGAALVTLGKVLAVWQWQAGLDPAPEPSSVWGLIGVPGLFDVASQAIARSCSLAMILLVLWQLFSWVLRSNVRGAVALGAVLLFGQSVEVGVGTITLFLLASVVLEVFAYTRLGLLAAVTMGWVWNLAWGFPLWSDPSAWFFSESVAVFVLGALPALWGAWVATRGSSTVAAPT